VSCSVLFKEVNSEAGHENFTYPNALTSDFRCRTSGSFEISTGMFLFSPY